MNEILNSLSQADPLWIYAIIFFVTYIENIFPPSPSDVAVVFGGALASMGRSDFLLALNAATIGSTLGFITVFTLGNWFGRRILDEGKLKFISKESVIKLDSWFAKYGYWLIVGNRFLAGTRAVVSFFAGMSHLEPMRTTVLSFISSLCWYAILIYGGYSLGNNWHQISVYLARYGEIVTAIVAGAIVVAIIRFIINKRKKARNV